MRPARALFLVLLLAMPPTQALAQMRGETQALFIQWLAEDLWPQASRAGISPRTFNAALADVSLQWDLPDLVPPGIALPETRRQSQAEFRAPAAYFSESALRSQAATGRELARRHAATLARIERHYGVPGHILLAIWARESAFGRAAIPHSAIDVLATKAFMSTRKDLFRGELLAALQILERGDIAPARMRSSWAGAMGQPQFLPSSYLKYAVDADGDGRRDIWDSVPDTLASIANYLARSGWRPGRDWGFEVTIPDDVSCAQEGPDRARPIAEWAAAGIARVSGAPFPESERQREGMMLVPAGRHGPAFIVTPNFYVIKEYNNSDNYALYVGNLGDRIAYGMGAFAGRWGDVGHMLRSEIAAIQRELQARGHDVGGADGLPGYKTRRSIGAWQQRTGRRQTCFPHPGMLPVLR